MGIMKYNWDIGNNTAVCFIEQGRCIGTTFRFICKHIYFFKDIFGEGAVYFPCLTLFGMTNHHNGHKGPRDHNEPQLTMAYSSVGDENVKDKKKKRIHFGTFALANFYFAHGICTPGSESLW